MITLEIPRTPDNPLYQANLINVKLFDLYEELQKETIDQSDKDFYNMMSLIFAHIGLCITHDSPEKINALLSFIAQENQKIYVKGSEIIN